MYIFTHNSLNAYIYCRYSQSIIVVHIKVFKIIYKTFILSPIGMAFCFMISALNSPHIVFNTHHLFIIPAGIIIAFGIVFWNWFDYEKYDTSPLNDFLESRHTYNLPYSEENWQNIRHIFQDQLQHPVNFKEQKESLQLELYQTGINSILSARKTDSQIQISIRKKKLSFLPDNATNYRILKKLQKKLKEK